MKSYDFLEGQLFVYFQLFVYLVPNSAKCADMILLMQYKVVSYEKILLLMMSAVCFLLTVSLYKLKTLLFLQI